MTEPTEPAEPPESAERCLLCGLLSPVADIRWLAVPGQPDWPVCADCYRHARRDEER